MIWSVLIIIFIICYVLIALEHYFHINKSAIALFLAVSLWTIVLCFSQELVTTYNAVPFADFLKEFPGLKGATLKQECTRFLIDKLMLEHIGDISETLFFLLGAMTVVELIDQHGGFNFITYRIKTKKTKVLLWTISIVTFVLSAILDNLTTSIVMIMLVRKLVGDQKLRWWFAGIIIVAANAGGAWSPIGDVTTIMLWVKGNITSVPTISYIFLPSLVAMLIPTFLVSLRLKGQLEPVVIENKDVPFYNQLTDKERMAVLILGVVGLLFIPVFKALTGMPPFMGVLFVLSILWIYTEVVYHKKRDIEEHLKNRVSRVISHIDMSTILFFLGILMAVAALQVSGILGFLSTKLDKDIHDIYMINGIIGVCSSIVDNVPLVAGAMGMYSIPTAADIAQAADPNYLSTFMHDGGFWQLLAYCAGVGGSALIIGSAAGVVVMGLEKINFTWYLKRFTLIVLIGYFAGIGVYYLETLFF